MRTRDACLIAFVTVAAFGQSADQPVRFEVASIKTWPPNAIVPGGYQGFTRLPDGFRALHVTLRGCLQNAYGVVDVSGPPWISQESYDIIAKADHLVSGEEFSAMFQNLLVDRFKLKLRWETKSSPAGVLTVSKNGIKNLHELESAGAFQVTRTNGRLEFKNSTISQVAGVLGSPFGNMPLERVIDETGLNGAYNLMLDLNSFDPKDPSFANYQEMREALFAFVSGTLERQYGLKLEKRNLPTKILVVDDGDKTPTPN